MENKNTLLEIQNLNASIEEKQIVKNLNLIIKKNEIHVIMGPNGSGKSTLSKILAGHPSYKITSGNVLFKGKNLLELSTEVRSHEGLFLAFQYPIEIAGVSNFDFLRIAYNEKQKYYKNQELNPLEFMELTEPFLKTLGIKHEFLNRNLNEGFSGGEKKKNEVLQILVLSPDLIILDELDSGLDVDALRIICQSIMENFYSPVIQGKASTTSILLITHYPKILQYLQPDFIHIMREGHLIKTGDLKLVKELEDQGYNAFSSNEF